MNEHGKLYSTGSKLGKLFVVGLAVVGALTIAKKIDNGEISVKYTSNNA